MPSDRETRIRAYLGDPAAHEVLTGTGDLNIDDLFQNGILPLEPHFERIARELIGGLMNRARQNVERIVKRLEQAGYLFEDRNYFTPPAADVASQIDAFEMETQLYLPLVFRAWVETIGRVCLMGTHPGWPEITYNGLGGTGRAICSDPLVAYWTPKHGRNDWKEWTSKPVEDRYSPWFRLEFAPDPGHKANYSSSGSFNLPMTAVPSLDAVVKDDDNGEYRRTFLEHIRDSFAHGGFPGWNHYQNAPVESLSELASGLETL